MEGILGSIVAQIAPVALTLVTGLGSLGMVYLNRWLKVKAGGESVSAVNEVVGAVVNELGATLAKDIRAAAADGKLTRQEAQDIKALAVTRVKAQLPNTVARAAGKAVGDLSDYIAGKIEEKVREAKNSER